MSSLRKACVLLAELRPARLSPVSRGVPAQGGIQVSEPIAEDLEKARGMIHRKDGLGVTVLGFGTDEVHFVWTHAVRSTLALRATEDALVNVLALALADARAKERERVAKLVRYFLAFDSQRAVSWHEVQDCVEAITQGHWRDDE